MIGKIIDLVTYVGKEVLKIYNSFSEFEILLKSDGSPLTLADEISNRIITESLQSISNLPIISEENKKIPYEHRKKWEKFWLVDPLDGTKEFIKKNGEFTINIALIENGKPLLGVVYAPAKDLLYFATPEGAFKREKNKTVKLKLEKPIETNKIRAVVSRSHLDEQTLKFLSFLETKTGKGIEKISIGSSLKICYIAEGKADIYPRFAPTMEWDTAAAHAILNFAGGKLVTVDRNQDNFLTNSELRYNKKTLKNPPFVAFNPYVF